MADVVLYSYFKINQYERNAIEALYNKGERDTDSAKGMTMFLLPNRSLKELIDAFKIAGAI